jgi:hypothetical protein
MRAEFFTPKDGLFATVEELQAALDGWVTEHNTIRPHQSCGGRPPAERFRLADRSITPDDSAAAAQSPPAAPRQAVSRGPPGVSRWVNAHGKISLAGFTYHAGAAYVGEPVEVVASGGLVDIVHAGGGHCHPHAAVPPRPGRPGAAGPNSAPARDATAGLTVTRLANRTRVVSFAGTDYQAGRAWGRQSTDVTIVAGSVQLSRDGKVIRVHPIRYDRARELGAFANPKGRPHRKNSAAGTVA